MYTTEIFFSKCCCNWNFMLCRQNSSETTSCSNTSATCQPRFLGYWWWRCTENMWQRIRKKTGSPAALIIMLHVAVMQEKHIVEAEEWKLGQVQSRSAGNWWQGPGENRWWRIGKKSGSWRTNTDGSRHNNSVSYTITGVISTCLYELTQVSKIAINRAVQDRTMAGTHHKDNWVIMSSQ